MKSLVLAVMVSFVLIGCATNTPIYVMGESSRKTNETKIVFANLDSQYEYLVYIPKTRAFGTGCWVYVPSQKHRGVSIESVRNMLNEDGFNSAPMAQEHTSFIDCNTGLVTFSYLLLKDGRLISNRSKRFTLFVVPSPIGSARVINLEGPRL